MKLSSLFSALVLVAIFLALPNAFAQRETLPERTTFVNNPMDTNDCECNKMHNSPDGFMEPKKLTPEGEQQQAPEPGKKKTTR
jgi:hypothetical protein